MPRWLQAKTIDVGEPGAARAQRHLVPWLSAVLAIALTSCGSGPQFAAPTQPAPSVSREAASPTPVPASPVVRRPAIGEIVWTSSVDPVTSQPGDTLTSYATDAPSIIAAAPGKFLPPGAVIEAAWTYNNTSLDAFTTSRTTSSGLEERWINFRLDRDPSVPWPVGTYEITIRLNGVEARRASVEVVENG